MAKDKQKYFFIDFDSTFIKSEGLEELAAIVLKNNKEKDLILEKIKELTEKGMEGKIPFDESLAQRLKLLNPQPTHVKKLAQVLKKNISSSIRRNKKFFKHYKDNIFIISGGFKEFILPVVRSFGIAEDYVYANTFLYDEENNIIGYDKNNYLAQENGKVKLAKSLNLKGDIYIIGDGYTDYKLKEAGIAHKFIAFTENIEREIVTEKADTIASSFDEFLYVNKLPTSLSYPKNRIRVLLLENIHKDAVTILEQEGYSVEFADKGLSEEELIKKIGQVSILGIRSRTQITQKVLEHAQRLLSIGVFAIGINQLDLSACSQKGVTVFNAPFSSTRSVAELIIGEIIMLERQIFEKSVKMHQGVWDKSAKGSHEIKGKTIGIIGYGNIGSQVGLLAEALGMNVLFYDIVEKPVLSNAVKCNSMEELLKKSDIITVHVDGNPQNKNLIGEREFKLMKNSVLFLNASRGFVVDINSLSEYIKNGKIKGAAVDVFPKEPKSNTEPFISPLQQLPNVILTPHIGAATQEAQRNIAYFVASRLTEYINTGSTYLSVNVPNIQLPEQGNAHRLLHLHMNVPGILAKINSILAENNINILGQYLKTNEEIGYVITDVNKKYDKKVLEILKQVPDTIRFRVLY